MATNNSSPPGSPSAHDEGIVLRILPKMVEKRVRALHKLLHAQYHVEQNFNAELHLLEYKYNKYYTEVYNKRNDIVYGNHEPTEEECDYHSDDENYDDKNASSVDKAEVVAEVLTHTKPAATPNVSDGSELIKGIPNFWPTVIKNIIPISQIIQSYDEPILSHLTDIKIRLSEEPGFTLEFCFSPNKWFTNTVLTKEYEMKYTMNKNNTFNFMAPKLCKCRGCVIQWKEGMNVTVKLVTDIKELVTKEGELPVEIVEKPVLVPSFFHYFSPPIALDSLELAIKQKIARFLADDYEVGCYIREVVIPKAVLYYTGEALIDVILADQRDHKSDSDDDDDYDRDIDSSIHLTPTDEEMMNRSDLAGDCKHH